MMYWITSTLIKSGAFASGNTPGMVIISIIADVIIVALIMAGIVGICKEFKKLKG